MRILTLSVLLLSLCPAAFAQERPGVADAGGAGVYAGRDLKLERDALAQRDKIGGMLPPWARHKLDTVSKSFLRRLLNEKRPADLPRIVREEMARRFADLSPQQSNLLTFYVLTGVVKGLPPHTDRAPAGGADREKLKDSKDGIEELSQEDMLFLQQLMEKKNQLESMISNILKAGFEGGQAAIQALKAS
jgi:hypothetical protein